jgi:adenylate kinase family enzyme
MRRGLVLLEGPDGAGKTTLARELIARNGGGHIVHTSYRWRDKMFTYHAAALHRAVKLARTSLVIMDRHWLSEEVYAHVYRGGTKVCEAARMHARVLRRYGCVNVLCCETPEFHAQFSTTTTRPETYRERAGHVAARYLDAYYGRLDPTYHPYRPLGDKFVYTPYLDVVSEHGGLQAHGWLRYQRERQSLDEGVREVFAYLDAKNEARVALSLHDDDVHFAGDVTATGLALVGDRPNAKCRAPDAHWPFYEHANCSLFLARSLSAAGVDERHVVLLNSCAHEHDIFTLTLGVPVIAMGNNAARRLTSMGIKHNVIPHPQHGRRFEPIQFMRNLLQALIIAKYDVGFTDKRVGALDKLA